MKDRIATVNKNRPCAEGIWSMTLAFDDLEEIKGAQFLDIKLPDRSKVLRRPFCICDFDKDAKTADVCYAVVGEGTKVLTEVKEGDKLNVLLPLGNGYSPKGKRIMLVGGGMGSAVLPAVITANPDKEFFVYLGFANAGKVVLEKEISAKGATVTVATDDGSYGKKGFVTSYAREAVDTVKPDEIFVCGPEVMYQAVRKSFEGCGVPVYVSLEQRMGCGIGACLVCNCKVKRADGEGYVRVCKDGPVFLLDEVVL